MNEDRPILEKGFFGGDFLTGAPCPSYCSPSCHPAQVGPEWVYGCLHRAWPQNPYDFCPIVGCGGKPEKCEIPEELWKKFRKHTFLPTRTKEKIYRLYRAQYKCIICGKEIEKGEKYYRDKNHRSAIHAKCVKAS